MTIRRFIPSDAEEISALVRRNFLEVNTQDYPLAQMQQLAANFPPAVIAQRAAEGHMYVILNDTGTIVATGTIAPYHSSQTQSILLTVSVLPQLQGQGLGKLIMQTLEQDEYFLRANYIVLHSSITACNFYRKLGYQYKDNVKQLVDGEVYIMEKFRQKQC